ncbi:MAG: organic hydroperoxide resistance protein [Myxococcota bacterium]
MKTLYETTISANGGRNGRARSTDGQLDFPLAMPTALGGTGDGLNPEQLFAAGYAACFLSAMQHTAKTNNIAVPNNASLNATVRLMSDQPGSFALSVVLAVSLPGMHQEQAVTLVEKAHAVCPYSKATRGNIEVRLVVLTQTVSS